MNDALFWNEEGIIYYKAGNMERAIENWRKAACLGSASAMFNIGTVCMRNSACSDDLIIAMEWYERAKKAGHKNADFQIAKIKRMLEADDCIISDSSPKFPNLELPYKREKLGEQSFLILFEDEEKMFCLSEFIVAVKPYHNAEEATTWENCSIRKWLNGDYFNLFDKAVSERIICKRILNLDNPQYNISGGNVTNDRVFLLSYLEVIQFLSNGNAYKTDTIDLMRIHDDDFLRKAYLKLIPIIQSSSKCEMIHDYNLIDGKPIGWWLRTPGELPFKAMRINCHGTLRTYGREVNRELVGIRPAFWIKKGEL